MYGSPKEVLKGKHTKNAEKRSKRIEARMKPSTLGMVEKFASDNDITKSDAIEFCVWFAISTINQMEQKK